ncbi:MAG: hypothetical protein QUT30_13730 [Acidobacteriota bacterium]|nr:hypothetical protein [Acidobacteriota bacterium]
MLRRKSQTFFVFAFIFLTGSVGLLPSALPIDDSKAEPKAERQTVAQKCLACHGSFDKLAEKTANSKAPSGETTTPHRYVPHADKTDIPECIECHVPHPIPLENKSDVVTRDNLSYCYQGCHHPSNLQPCKNCH